jgi:hypothetical protein
VPRTITRSGRQRTALAAAPDLVADVLADPSAVTDLLGDLLDQQRSDPTRWVLPPIRLGLRSFGTTLAPTFARSGNDVRINAVTTPSSDVEAHLAMEMSASPIDGASCHLDTEWHLALAVPLPRAALRLAGPGLDRTVTSTLQRIMHRTEVAVLAAAE